MRDWSTIDVYFVERETSVFQARCREVNIMTSHNSLNNENEISADMAGKDKADDVSDFATAEVSSDANEFGASIDSGIEAAKVAASPVIHGARGVFMRNGRSRRPSSIL